MIKEGSFMEGLYYRIAVLEIQIVPLRERPSDIAALINSRVLYEQRLTARDTQFQIEEAAVTALSFYDWPGNIRELQNIVSRLTARVSDNEPITQADVYAQLPYESPSTKVRYSCPPLLALFNPTKTSSAISLEFNFLQSKLPPSPRVTTHLRPSASVTHAHHSLHSNKNCETAIIVAENTNPRSFSPNTERSLHSQANSLKRLSPIHAIRQKDKVITLVSVA
jgi:DNA-binding NtrC family response regulator